MIWLIIAVIVISVLAIFAAQNAVPVTISFFFWKFEASLAIVIFLSFFAGIIIAAIVISTLRIGRSGKKGGIRSDK